MSLFKNTLQKISNSLDSHSYNYQLISTLLTKILGVKILPTNIIIRDKKIIIQSSPTIKMAIKLKEKELISILKKQNIDVNFIV